MTTGINDAGSWVDLAEVAVNDVGIWRDIQEIYVKDGGVWTLVFQKVAPVLLTNHAITDSAVGSPAAASFNIGNDGVASFTRLNSGSGNYSPEWLLSGSPADYEVRWTVGIGVPSGSPTGTWLNCGTTRSWAASQAVPGENPVSGTVEIRHAVSWVVLASAAISVNARYL